MLPIKVRELCTISEDTTVVLGKGILIRLISLFSLLFVLLATPKMASAYVDPGSGAMIWQMGAAAVIGSLFYVKRILMWVKGQLGVRATAPESGSTATHPPTV